MFGRDATAAHEIRVRQLSRRGRGSQIRVVRNVS